MKRSAEADISSAVSNRNMENLMLNDPQNIRTQDWLERVFEITLPIIVFAISGLLAGLIGMVTYFILLKVSLASKVVPLVATYPLVTAILSTLFLKEPITIERLLGTVFIVAGVFLVK